MEKYHNFLPVTGCMILNQIIGTLILKNSLVQVHVKRCVLGSEDNVSSENGDSSHLTKPSRPLVRKSKLVVVDLAGSERIQKSGGYPTLCPSTSLLTLWCLSVYVSIYVHVYMYVCISTSQFHDLLLHIFILYFATCQMWG